MSKRPVLVCLSVLCLALLSLSASAQTPAPTAEAPVTLHGATVFVLRGAAPDPRISDRAADASRTLNAVAATKAPIDVRVEHEGTSARLVLGKQLLLQIDEAEARVAGSASAQAYAAQLAPRIRDALRAERRRAAIANTVFSISLVVLFGLITLFLLRKVTDFAVRAQTFLDAHPDKVPGVELRSLEVLGPGSVRSILLVSLSVGRWLGLLGLMYAWLVVSLSLFDSTRGYTLLLTGLVLSPLSGLFARIASSLPLFGVAVIAAAAVSVLARLVSLFFASVARRETRLAWLPAELAPAASFALNTALVVSALVFGAPIITGDAQGALAKAATVALVFVGLAVAPLLVCIAVGVGVIFLRRLTVGERFAYGGETGRIQEIAITHVHLRADDGSHVFVPHVLALVHATRAYRDAPQTAIEIEISCEVPPERVVGLLLREIRATVDVIWVDATRVRYRVARFDPAPGAQTRLWLDLTRTLGTADIALATRAGSA